MPLNFNGRRPSTTVLVALVIAAACTAGADKAVGPSPIVLDRPNYAAAAAAPLGAGVVISQVYGGGGNSGATVRNDFIELYNGTGSDISLAGASVQYGSAAGTGAWTVTPLTGTILSGHYYLVRESAGAGGSVSVPTPDDSGSIAMSATAGKVALVKSTTALSGACPIGANVVDVVGFGAANCFETAPTAALTNTTAAFRKDGGRQDNNNNSTDFSTGAPNARNSKSEPLPPLNVLQVTITPQAPSVVAASPLVFTAAASRAGLPVAITSAAWSSSNPAVATIDETSGAATTLTRGTSTITVAAVTPEGNASSSTILTVSAVPAAPATVVVSPNTWSMKTGQSKTFTATAKDADGNPSAVPFTWNSSNPAIVTVDATSGAALARTVGSAKISATTPNGKSDTATVTVTAGNVVVQSRPDSLPVGFQTQLFLNSGATDSNGNPVANTDVAWASSNADVVSVDAATGVITANSKGSAVITATAKSDGISSGSTTIVTHTPAVSPTARVGHNTELGIPADADPSDDIIIARRQYTLSYNASRGGPNWVSWNLDASHKGSASRCNCMTADTALLRFGIRPYDTNDWINGVYSRGHVSPSADWAVTPGDNAPTFFMSNMIAQNQIANSGAWGALENDLRTLATPGTEIYIIAGPLFTKNRGGAGVDGFGFMPRINASTARIAVPDSIWKVAIIVPDTRSASEIGSPSDVQVIAVNMPNEASSTGTWTRFQTTIDRIERSTGYDLLSALPKDLQCRIEVRNCVPAAHITGAGLTGGDEGETLSFSASTSSDADAGDVLSYRWDVAGQPAGDAASLNYTFADNGSYAVRLIVTDPKGAADTSTVTIAIANVPPRVAAFSGATIIQGETYSAAGSFADPGADRWNGSVDYGDGSGTSALALDGKSFELQHQFTSAGSFTVGVEVRDEDGGSGSSFAHVNVLTSQQAIGNLTGMVTRLGGPRDGLNKGQVNSLQVKLENASKQLESGNTEAASGMLGAFLNEMDAMVRSGRLDDAAAAPVIDYARRVLASIGG